MPTPHKDLKLGWLVLATYGLVILTVAGAAGAYYYMSSQIEESAISQDQAGKDRLVPVGDVWVMQYPGARLQPAEVRQQANSEGIVTEGEMPFQSADAPADVLNFYKDKLSSAGYLVSNAAEREDGGSVQAVRFAGRTRVQVVVSSEQQTDGTIASSGILRTFSRRDAE